MTCEILPISFGLNLKFHTLRLSENMFMLKMWVDILILRILILFDIVLNTVQFVFVETINWEWVKIKFYG